MCQTLMNGGIKIFYPKFRSFIAKSLGKMKMSKCGFKNNFIPISGEREKRDLFIYWEKKLFF